MLGIQNRINVYLNEIIHHSYLTLQSSCGIFALRYLVLQNRMKKGGDRVDDSQLMKGILEGCVLSVIAQGETYGYEILQKFADAGFDNLQEGTLYPVLTRLEKKGYISCRKAKSPLGPIRKYYSVTGSGDEFLSHFKVTYRRVTDCANAMLDI